MVQLTAAAAGLLTVAQVALYSTPAFAGPVELKGRQLKARGSADSYAQHSYDPQLTQKKKEQIKHIKNWFTYSHPLTEENMQNFAAKEDSTGKANRVKDWVTKQNNQAKQRRALEYELAQRDLESLYDLATRDLHFDTLEERSGPIDDLD